jgi:septal ring factor EnvC (AmiA/AmiB activator)
MPPPRCRTSDKGLPKAPGAAIFEAVMKMKIGIVILAVVCVGLAIALFATKKQADDQRKTDDDHILDFSNQLVTASENLDDLRQVNLKLTNDLAMSQQQTLQLSNSFVTAATALSNSLASTKSSLAAAQDQIANLNGRITDLEAQNQVLDQRAAELTNTIASLTAQITDTTQKLVTSETNNIFLEKELQDQMAKKAELERKFNDIDDVRAQVKKLHDELFVARRLQFMRSGITDQKGAQLLMQRIVPNTAASDKQSPHYDLNVEVGSDGSVHVIPPQTNAPAATTNAPAQ